MRECLTALAAAGVATVHASYSGSGDEGQVDYVGGFTAENLELVLDGETEEALGAWLDDLLDEVGANFDNDGCAGEITIDVAARTVHVGHGWYVADTEADPHDFRFAADGSFEKVTPEPPKSTLATLFAEGQRIPDLDDSDLNELADLVVEEVGRRRGHGVTLVRSTWEG